MADVDLAALALEAADSGKDLHTLVASHVFDVAEKDVTAEQRKDAKRLVYEKAYGREPKEE